MQHKVSCQKKTNIIILLHLFLYGLCNSILLLYLLFFQCSIAPTQHYAWSEPHQCPNSYSLEGIQDDSLLCSPNLLPLPLTHHQNNSPTKVTLASWLQLFSCLETLVLSNNTAGARERIMQKELGIQESHTSHLALVPLSSHLISSPLLLSYLLLSCSETRTSHSTPLLTSCTSSLLSSPLISPPLAVMLATKQSHPFLVKVAPLSSHLVLSPLVLLV